jgi:hypothetical protein
VLQATVASFLQYNGTQQGYLIDIDAGDRPRLLVNNAGDGFVCIAVAKKGRPQHG